MNAETPSTGTAENPLPPVVIVGGGGHARVLIDSLRRCGRKIIGFTDPRSEIPHLMEVPRLGGDEALEMFLGTEAVLLNAIAGAGSTALRRRVFESLRARGFQFHGVTHPSTVIAEDLRRGEGVQILAGSIVQPNVVLGDNSILNTGASVDHDCVIGEHVHLAPRSVLCGGARIRSGVHVGANATILQGIVIGEEAVIGAGAVVTENVPARVTVAGVPARIINTHV